MSFQSNLRAVSCAVKDGDDSVVLFKQITDVTDINLETHKSNLASSEELKTTRENHLAQDLAALLHGLFNEAQ